MIRTFLVIASLLIALCFISSCATTLSPAASKLHDADQKMVSDCKFLGTIFGSSSATGIFRSIGAENSKNEVLEEAVKRGATHVVWKDVSDNYWGPNARANAYKCAK